MATKRKKPYKGEGNNTMGEPLAPGFIATERELIVITNPETKLRSTPEGVASATGVDVSSLASVLESEGIRLEPLFGLSEERMEARMASAAAPGGKESQDLATFYKVDAPDEKLDELAERLIQLETIAAAYVKPPAEPPVALPPQLNSMIPIVDMPPINTPDFNSRQQYLNAAPIGVDAHYAWTKNGGRGTGVKIIDCEWGWRFTHEDLIQNQMGVVVGISSSSDNHGTAVLGEISGDVNNIGVQGICPDAVVGAASFVSTSSAMTIMAAADKLSAGDIILLEIHRSGPNSSQGGQQGFIAIEWWPDDFTAIRYAVGKGIIVVEAAGNGWENLDDAIYNTPASGFPAFWKNPFNPANPSSEAVLVGAGSPPSGTHGRTTSPWSLPYVDRARCGFSNYGARVDSQGWGWEVTSTGYGDLQGGTNKNEWYTDTFSGTSSASPIVVGVLGCLQGILKARGLPILTPLKAISLLRSTGSPQQAAAGRPTSQRIGNRPNLRQLIARISQTWHYGKKVLRTFASPASQNAWAYIENIGWRKIKNDSADGVSNMFIVFCEAAANNKEVNVYLDGTYIYYMFMV
jgi:Subtilase family